MISVSAASTFFPGNLVVSRSQFLGAGTIANHSRDHSCNAWVVGAKQGLQVEIDFTNWWVRGDLTRHCFAQCVHNRITIPELKL
jgi:hypothetical protein